VPEPVATAIERALAKVPADRFASAGAFAEALHAVSTPESTVRRRRAPRTRLSVVVVTLAVIAAAAGGFRLMKVRRPRILPSAASIAVLPFAPPTGDSALTRLGNDLAVTVSASLDGVGGLTTTDRISIAGAIKGKQNLSIAEGAELARRLGASSVLRGTLVGPAEHVRLDLGLYDTKSLAPLATAITVTGHRDSLGALTDSVTWALLRQIWQRGDAPSPSLSAVTTKSLPALRAFLEGERTLAAGDPEAAALAYRSAMAADSTMWLAYFGYLWAQSWSDEPVEPAVIKALERQRDSLPERERLMLDGFLVTDRTARLKIEAYRRVTQRFPQYWPGWWLYADQLYHQGSIIGYDWSEALDALRRVVAMNPQLVPAWEHIQDVAIARDPVEAHRALVQLFEIGYPPSAYPEVGRIRRLFDGIGGTGGMIPKDLQLLADSVVRDDVYSPDDGLVFVAAPLRLLQRGFPAAQLDMNQRALGLAGLRRPVRGARLVSSAWSWATRGAWDSALSTMDEAVGTYDGRLGWTSVPVSSYSMAVLGAWLGVVDPAEADRRRIGAMAAIDRLPEDTSHWSPRHWDRGIVAWLDGLLGFARKDRAAIQTARMEAKRSGYFRADLVDQSLAAFDRALAGDRNEAARQLVAMEEACIGDQGCPSNMPHIAVQRMMAATWLREEGDLEAARRLLRWHDTTWIGWAWTFTDAVSGPIFLMQAEIEVASGDSARAREYYGQFLRRYDRPMPSQVQLVKEARAALAELSEEHHND
jgi:tetratricopeptide (TPR) repeat protein/TolB-like protein